LLLLLLLLLDLTRWPWRGIDRVDDDPQQISRTTVSLCLHILHAAPNLMEPITLLIYTSRIRMIFLQMTLDTLYTIYFILDVLTASRRTVQVWPRDPPLARTAEREGIPCLSQQQRQQRIWVNILQDSFVAARAMHACMHALLAHAVFHVYHH